MKNRFEDVDLGTKASLRRMDRTIIRQRNEMIDELADELAKTYPEAADVLRLMKEELPDA